MSCLKHTLFVLGWRLPECAELAGKSQQVVDGGAEAGEVACAAGGVEVVDVGVVGGGQVAASGGPSVGL